MSDGLVKPYENIEALCKRLNDDEVGFRPMAKNEMIHIVDVTGNRFKS